MMNLTRSILAIREAASKDETRYNLNGVYFDGAKVCATDGHALAEIELHPAEGEPIPNGDARILDRRGLDAIAKAIPKAQASTLRAEPTGQANGVQTFRIVDHGPGTGDDGAERGTLPVAVIDGEFPDYRQVMPKGEPKAWVFLSASLLGNLLKIAREFHPESRSQGVTLELRDPLSPVVLRAERDDATLTAVVMPMRP